MRLHFFVSAIIIHACSPSTTDTTGGATWMSEASSTSTDGGTTFGTTTSGTPTTSSSTTTTGTSTTEEPCPIGSIGCSCTNGGGCDVGLMCNDGTCVEGTSPPCHPDVPQDDCCGDGVLDDFEDCDLGSAMNDDSGECTTLCKSAVCGDGFVHENVEACDGVEHCSNDCTFTTCGNGSVDPWEACEKTRPDDPECTDLCTDARKVIFITSERYVGGEIGGVEGGDAKCQEHANAAGLPGVFRAWLAVSELATFEKNFAWSKVMYVNVSGEEFFTYPTLDCIGTALNEFGGVHPGCSEPYHGSRTWVWFDSHNGSCDGWSTSVGVGSAMAFPSCSAGDGAPCSASAPIVCVEE